jgi:hypothetical protein
VNIVHSYKGTVFISYATGALFKLLAICICPPVPEIAFSIKLAALIVEAMGQFMADHDADSAVVDSIILTLIEERRL